MFTSTFFFVSTDLCSQGTNLIFLLLHFTVSKNQREISIYLAMIYEARAEKKLPITTDLKTLIQSNLYIANNFDSKKNVRYIQVCSSFAMCTGVTVILFSGYILY